MKGKTWLAVGAIVAGLAFAGCGGDDEGGSDSTSGSTGGGKTGTVTVGIALDSTGPAGFTGVEGKKGIDLAVEQANADKALGDATLAVDIKDGASDPKQAASLMTSMVKDYPVVSQGMTSGGALAAAPIAQKAGVPIAIILAGAPGIVETGDFVYRANAPQPTYHHLLAEHFKNQGVKTVAQVYNNDVPTNETLAEETWPELAKQNGFQITSSDGVGATATNFASIVSKINSAKPDAVVMHLTGAQHVTFATALKRAGYQGKVAGGAGLGAGILKPMGDQADGILFPIDFSAANPDPKIKTFVDAYKAKYNEDPSPYAADAYDAIQLITKSLAASESFEPDAIKAGMEKVAGEGFDGAAGAITFENRDARVPGVLVEWRGGKENVIQP
jgi:branched-chain amino acid transport system substrate-binding protein